MAVITKMVWEIERDRENLYNEHCVQKTSKQQTIVTVEYAKLVCKKLRGTKWAVRNSNSCWIYKEGDTLAMGWVGYGDWQTNVTGDDKFVIYSAFHENGKYVKGSIQSYMAMLVDRDKAINKAKSILRSHTVEETAKVLNLNNAGAVCEVQGKASEAVRKIGKELGLDIGYTINGHTMLSEFKNMLSTGYNFLDQEVEQNVHELLNAFKVNDKRKVSVIPMYYIETTKNRWGEEQVGIALIKNARQMHRVEVDYTDTLLPEDVEGWMKQRVAALQMLPIGSYVEGVGYKVCNTAYYIHTQDNNPFDDEQ